MQPLEGIKILDLSRLAPGPFCSMMLGDLGADVLLVEAPADGKLARGDRRRAAATRRRRPRTTSSAATSAASSSTCASTRRARSSTSSPRRPTSCSRASGPGVVKRLGVDYETLSKRNPRIVYCSLSGFGQTGPYSQLVGHDINYISVGGALGMIGWPDQPPAIPMNIIADFAGGGMHAAYGILAALMARERTGRGQYVDIAMSDGVLYLLASMVGGVLMGGGSPSARRARCSTARCRTTTSTSAATAAGSASAAWSRTSSSTSARRWSASSSSRTSTTRRSATRSPRTSSERFAHEDARRVVRDPQADRHLRRPGVLAGRGAARSAQPRARDGGRSRPPDARQGEDARHRHEALGHAGLRPHDRADGRPAHRRRARIDRLRRRSDRVAEGARRHGVAAPRRWSALDQRSAAQARGHAIRAVREGRRIARARRFARGESRTRIQRRLREIVDAARTAR